MSKQILLICADQRQAVRVQVALLRYGCMVEVAGTFRRGLSVIQHRPPTAIVIDEALPQLDSDRLARALADSPATAAPSVVMLPLHAPAMPRAFEPRDARPAIGDEAPERRVVAELRHKGVLS